MTAATHSEEIRRHFVERLSAAGMVRSEAWRAAFAAVPRELFLTDFARPSAQCAVNSDDGTDDLDRSQETTSLAAVYEDSQLAMLAGMLEALEVLDTSRVLEVGTDNGYSTALLAHRYGPERVVSVEGRGDPDAARQVRDRLTRIGLRAAVVTGEAAHGCLERAPFGGLVARAPAGARIPAAWLAQVIPGGMVVVTLGPGLITLTRRQSGIATGYFSPTLGEPPPPPRLRMASARVYIPALLLPLAKQAHVPLTADLSQPMAQLLGALVQPDVCELALTDVDGQAMFGLVHPESASWARVAPLDDGTARIHYDGPRDLWAERAPMVRAWAAAGCPGPERYGLTVAPNGAHRLWLDHPDGPAWPL